MMTVPRLRPQNKCTRATQQVLGMNSRGRAQTVFFMALFVATVLFLNNLTHLGDIPSAGRGTSVYVPPPAASLANQGAEGKTHNPPPPPPPEAPKMEVPQPEIKLPHVPDDTDNKEVPPVLDQVGLVGDKDPSPASAGEPPAKDNKINALDDTMRRQQYAKFEAELGILSDTPFATFLEQHQAIDDFDNTQRCRRYGYTYAKEGERSRRVFYGAVMADEPWELFEILAAESYGIFEAMVLMEPDKDIYGQARKPLRLEATALLQSLFGVEKVKVIKYSNSDDKVKGQLLYDMAREEIVQAWKDLGMTVDDVGYMSAIDDMFARDYLKAIQHCELPEMKYELHHCLHNRVKTFGNCQVYETSPDCVSRTKKYEHPDMMIGACIKGIGNETLNRIAPRDKGTGIYRDKGWNCEDREKEKDIKDQKYPLWTGTDMRQLCGGRQANLRAAMHQQYSAFHFRNFYNTARDMRLQYTTQEELYDKSMDDLGENMRVTYRCIKEIDDEKNAVTKREPGGFKVLKPVTPLYFADEKYRDAAHERAKKKILEDEKNVKADTKKEKKKDDGSNTKKKDAEKDAKKETADNKVKKKKK